MFDYIMANTMPQICPAFESVKPFNIKELYWNKWTENRPKMTPFAKLCIFWSEGYLTSLLEETYTFGFKRRSPPI